MSIEQLNEQIRNCRRCPLWQGATQAVPGEGPIDAKVMLVGQNPGAEEDKAGRPFVGRAGKFLTKTLAENGINRAELFITNIVKHITPGNRKPSADEIAACIPYLLAQIAIVKPKVIVLLGATAKETPRLEGIEYMEIIHPSAAMRFKNMREKFEKQIAELALRLQRLA
ncbi:MAG: uracil-DNA glycosylase [Candidatus Bathyarchaeota archaeon]|nr:uracil-DNA glycosylase [Candidatus Bathyarchaeota archaeon]